MEKIKFVSDYQINTSKKIIYPYLSTASGLSQ
ncbi:MAG: ATPase, partial [Cyclobacteriaceae bacterium]